MLWFTSLGFSTSVRDHRIALGVAVLLDVEVLLVARGLSTSAMAERRVLSPWTVQDHLKPISEKTGTRSGRELRAQIFFSEYLPGIVTRRPLDAKGALGPAAPAPATGSSAC